jgi:hypothetical protein
MSGGMTGGRGRAGAGGGRIAACPRLQQNGSSWRPAVLQDRSYVDHQRAPRGPGGLGDAPGGGAAHSSPLAGLAVVGGTRVDIVDGCGRPWIAARER